jgi:uncharacterized protein YjbJ (UPF0337 family)
MNEEHCDDLTYINGVGKIKEAAGHITGDRKLENEGNIDQFKGAVHNAMGDAKDSSKEAFKRP